jgi:hypothetical protein
MEDVQQNDTTPIHGTVVHSGETQHTNESHANNNIPTKHHYPARTGHTTTTLQTNNPTEHNPVVSSHPTLSNPTLNPVGSNAQLATENPSEKGYTNKPQISSAQRDHKIPHSKAVQFMPRDNIHHHTTTHANPSVASAHVRTASPANRPTTRHTA